MSSSFDAMGGRFSQEVSPSALVEDGRGVTSPYAKMSYECLLVSSRDTQGLELLVLLLSNISKPG